MTDFNLTHLLKRPQYGLLGLIAWLSTLSLATVWRVNDLTLLGMSGLFLLATLTLIWENHPTYCYRHDRLASLLAIGLIVWVVWQSGAIVSESQAELRLLPFVSALAIALLASGFSGLVQYRRELAIMFFLGVPNILLKQINISLLTAHATAKILSWKGFEVRQEDVFLYLPDASMKVHNGCSGIQSITYLLGIAVICLTLYPMARSRQIVALIGSIAIGFGVNAARVAMMTTLSKPGAETALAFWNTGNGALITGAAALILFAALYWLLYRIELRCAQYAQ
ncbi:MAG: cyanoexosortase A [Elainella sp. Prado103]|jgi:cyanoexosortase A|nr:cyanoexosortase A [Elainella sp. Prado103]